MTSPNQNGFVITGSGTHIVQAMDSLKSGTPTSGSENGWNSNNSSTGWWQLQLPYKISVYQLIHYNNYFTNPQQTNFIGQFFADSQRTKPLGNSFSSPSYANWSSQTITFTPVITDIIYLAKTGGSVWSGMGELDIFANRYYEIQV